MLSRESERLDRVEPDVVLPTTWSLSMPLVRGTEASPAPESQILRVGYLMAPDDNWGRVSDE
jgi:hypothetical protein